jgi:flagellar biosynthesis/type III secretory pathway protein FliH
MTDAPRTLIEELARRAQMKEAEARRGQDIRPAPFFVAAQAAHKSPAWALDAPLQSLEWRPEGTPQPSAMGGAAHLEEIYEQVFQEARQDGYAAGLEQGALEGQQRAAMGAEADLAELRQVILSLAESATKLEEVRADLMKAAEDDAIALALKIGRRLALEAQLESTEWVAPMLREAMLALTDSDKVVCLISHELHERLEKVEDLGVDCPFEVRPGLGPLDVVIESRFGRVDASFQKRFDNLVNSVDQATGANLSADLVESDPTRGPL